MLHLHAPEFWYRYPPGPLALSLVPLGWLYGQITRRRMARTGVRLPCPVICIGNFSVGGTGKTPMAILVAKSLHRRGHNPFFLSRGYGAARQNKALRVVPALHDATMVGDEPRLLASHAPVVVGADRLGAGNLAISQGADVLVMDDGLQNPQINKNLACAMVDGARGFGNGLCMPAGPLRAPLLAQWPLIQALIVVGEGSAGELAATAARAAGKTVLTAQLVPDPEVAAKLKGQDVIAFAGIGRPSKFFETLAQTGARIVEAHPFPDHYAFNAAEMARLQRRARQCNALLVTTQKDLARSGPWSAEPQPIALPASLQLDNMAQFETLLDQVFQRFTA